MSVETRDAPTSAVSWFAAFSVHLLTASGAVWGLLALRAIDDGRLRAALGWMALALIVDGIDGPLARRVRVGKVTPWIDGSLLDNLIDYLTYVVVPCYLILRAELLPARLALPALATVAVVSALQFAHRDAKPGATCFRGFPCYWNVVAFYLLVLRPAPWMGLTALLGLAALVLVPILYVHPVRTPELRPWTLALTAVWAVAVGVLVAGYPDHPPWLAPLSMGYFVYYFGLSFALTARERTSR